MAAVWRNGWQVVVQSRRVVAACVVLNAAVGILCLITVWYAFGVALNDALPTRSLLTNLDPNVWLDLIANERARVITGVQFLALLAGVALLLSVWTNGILASVVASREKGLRLHGRNALVAWPRLLRLAIGTWLIQAALFVAVFLLARWVTHRMGDGASQLAVASVQGVAAGFVILLVALLTLVHDHARLRAVNSERGAGASFLWTLDFLRCRAVQAAGLLFLFAAVALALTLLHYELSTNLSTTSTSGVMASLGLGEIVLLMRTGLRTALYDAEWRLQAQFERPD